MLMIYDKKLVASYIMLGILSNLCWCWITG